jgi:hypothetical protein
MQLSSCFAVALNALCFTPGCSSGSSSAGKGIDAAQSGGPDGGVTQEVGGSGVGHDTGGAAVSCGTCFTTGRWQIDNLSPCFFTIGTSTTPNGAVSTVLSGALSQCPSAFSTAPAEPWSTDTFTADCVGHYRLCYTLKTGNAKSPQASDCVVAQSCAEGEYAAANQPQKWTDLPGWITTSSASACSQTFYAAGGYGEMSVSGVPLGCGQVTKTLASVTYCPQTCLQNPSSPGCADCAQGGNGSF